MRRHCFTAGTTLLCLVTAVFGTRAADDKDHPAIPLDPVKPLPMIAATDPKLVADWPALKHKPIATAGFNALMLPMHYADPLQIGDAAVANAFSFLLSSDLDFSPGSYNARHAYFVFKRSPKQMLPMKDDYDPTVVSEMIKQWGATHAVGGTITRGDKGYTGELQIFAPDGTVKVDKKFDEPRDYFDLLGDMSVAVMTELDTAPTPALVKHLHEKRASMDSITDLGDAAFAKERSDEEFALYDKILARDPGFGQVRAWVANQKGWTGMPAGEQAEQEFAAMKGFPTMETLRTMSVPLLTNDEAAEVPGMIAHMQELVGPDSPQLQEVITGVKSPTHRHPTKPELADAVRLMQKYPNSFWLEYYYLAYETIDKVDPFDPSMQASVALTAVTNLYQPGAAGKRNAPADTFAVFAIEAGLPDEAAAMVATEEGTLSPKALVVMIRALMQSGRHAEVCDIYSKLENQPIGEPGEVEELVIWSAAMTGKTELIQHIIDDHADRLDRFKLMPLAKAYVAMLQGQPVDAQAIADANKKPGSLISDNAYLLLQGLLDLKAGTADRMPTLAGAVGLRSWRPSVLVRLDGYEKQKHQPGLDEFYQALHYVYPDDPQAAALVNARTHRAGAAPFPDVDVTELDEVLKDCPPRPFDKMMHAANWTVPKTLPLNFTWDVAAIADAKCRHGDFDGARKLARQLMTYADVTRQEQVLTWADRLYYKIDSMAPAKPAGN